jgi:hypothetical protein
MAEQATKKPNSSNIESVEIGVILFFLAAAAVFVVWQALHMPDIAKWVLLGGLGLHALIAIFSSFGDAIRELNTNPSFADRRNFGLIFLVGVAAIGVVYWQVYDKGDLHRAQYFFGVAVAVFILSLVPPIGRVLYILWMGFGLTLGLVTSPVIMFLLFLILITPVGIIFKMTGRDLMRRKLDEKSESYWEDYPKTDDPSRYVKQF